MCCTTGATANGTDARQSFRITAVTQDRADRTTNDRAGNRALTGLLVDLFGQLFTLGKVLLVPGLIDASRVDDDLLSGAGADKDCRYCQ